MDDGCLDMDRAFHVGCRGSVKSPDVLREDREQGWTTIGQHHMGENSPHTCPHFRHGPVY